MTDIIERLEQNYIWLIRDGFTTSAANVQDAKLEITRLRAEVESLRAAAQAKSADETERDGAYDRACRDPRDNCPTEGAVLKREWRQKTATIAILSATVQQQAARFERLRAAADALLTDMHEPDDSAEANFMQAVRDAMGQ